MHRPTADGDEPEIADLASDEDSSAHSVSDAEDAEIDDQKASDWDESRSGPALDRRTAVRRSGQTAAVDSQPDSLTVLLTAFEVGPEKADDETIPPSPQPNGHKAAASRLQVPPELPGSSVQSLQVPPFDPQQSLSERRTVIQKLYPALPSLPQAVDEDPLQPQWTLRELEDVAWENHPALMRAAAEIEVARGEMIQAGLHPNPTVGYEGDTVNTLGTAGYHGPYITQQVVTGGKLQLARCASAMDYENANIAYQQTKIEIATRVRDAYYDLLVFRQRRRMLSALTRFTDEIYQAQIELVAGGQAAPYEPLQLRVFAVQARNAVLEANNGVIGASRRLGAATGMPDAEDFQIDGHAEFPLAGLNYQSAKAYLWENHTELRTVRNQIVQAQYLSRLEYIRPRIPDLSFYSTVQKDYTGPPFGTTFNLQVGAPIPVFDRNQGNILARQSSILGNERAYSAKQNQLAGNLAEILVRYDTARMQAENYRVHILPDQVRTYRGVYSRYREGGQAEMENLNFGDVVVAQQTLSMAVSGYADVLNQMWQAYVDVAELLQVEDLATLDAWFGQQ